MGHIDPGPFGLGPGLVAVAPPYPHRSSTLSKQRLDLLLHRFPTAHVIAALRFRQVLPQFLQPLLIGVSRL
jgi:hypothetical protein